MISPTLNVPQARFLSMPHKFKAYIAGFGSGKTWVGCGGICKEIWEHPGINQGYFAPTYPQIRDIFYPTVEEVAADWGLNVKINEGNKEVHFYYGRQYRGTTICRSMEKPQTIVGFKIGNALVDELDILPKEKARTAWRKIIARMRYKIDGLRNGIDVTTTPEGFKFVYEQFVKAVREKTELASLYGLVQASTFDNEKNLPADYIPSLLESYPPELIKAYLRGQFTNLTSGTVYHQFDRKLNNCEEVEQPGEPIYIGMDFNVGKMAGIVHVLRLGLPCAVTFAGLDWESKADDTNFIKGEPVDSAGKLRYSFKEVSAVSLNGVAGGNGFCIDSFDIQFDNKLQTQRCIGTGSPYAGANIPTTFTPSGTVTLSWSKSAWEIWSKTLTGETVPFSFTLSNGEGAYTFSFPKVQVSGEWPDGGNTDIIQVQLSITAADEAPTITRKKNSPAAVIAKASAEAIS